LCEDGGLCWRFCEVNDSTLYPGIPTEGNYEIYQPTLIKELNNQQQFHETLGNFIGQDGAE
jgi:hypothetical protein